MEKSQTENDELRRLEKDEDEFNESLATKSEHKRTNDQIITTDNGQNALPLKPSIISRETKPCNTKACYLATKPNPVTIDDHRSEGQTSQDSGNTPCDSSQESNPTDTINLTPTYEHSDRAPAAGDQSSSISPESDNQPSENQNTPSTIHHQCKISQTVYQTSQFQINTIQESAFKSVSKRGTTVNSCLERDATSIQNRSENGHKNSSFTPRKLPFQDHSYANVTLKQSPVKSYYLETGSWDPLCHHMCDDEKNIALPHDLRYLKESELLPMAYGDFTKSLEENLCCSPTEMMTLVDDDGVVPSSPLLPRDDTKCHAICSDTSSTDGSQECSWESLSARNEDIYKSPSLSYNYPQYGTLNWGLTPTIIYKTPDPKASLQDVGDDYMKCSISEGNVELLTPPPPNYKKLLRLSRSRMKRRHVKRRRIYFGNDEDYEGLQEVPVDESEKDSEKSPDTDFVPDDPMWFEDEDENVMPDSEDKLFSLIEQDIVDCCECLGNVSPNSEGTIPTYQILTEAVEYIENLEETLNDFNAGREEDAEMIAKKSDKCNELNTSCEDVSGILPQWSKIDEPSYEIQEILDSFDLPEEAPLDGCEEAASTDLSVDEEKSSKRKRKYQKSSNRKRKMPRKQKKSSERNTRSNKAGQCLPDDNSSSQRSDCESVNLYERNTRSNSSSRCNSQGSRCVTPIMPKPTPGVLVSPSIMGFIPLETIGKPLILPKPPPQRGSFSSPTSPLGSPLASPQLVPNMTQTLLTWLGSGQAIEVPAKKCCGKASSKERPIKEKRKDRRKGLQKKAIPNGYMLFCKDKRNRVFKANPDLKSKPGDITKLLSEKWNELSEEERRPYVEEAMKLRCDESEWINQTP